MSAIGVNRPTVASSPAWAACMTRLYSRSNRSRGDMLLMSGGTPAPLSTAVGPADTSGAGALRATISRTTPSNPTNAAPAMIQGVRSVRTATGVGDGPTPFPQTEQNLAPSVTDPPHPRQVNAPSGAPQVEQNCPEPAAPHATQVVALSFVIGGVHLGGGSGVSPI